MIDLNFKIKKFIKEYKEITDYKENVNKENDLLINSLLNDDITTKRIRIKQLYNALYYRDNLYILDLIKKDLLKDIKEMEIKNKFLRIKDDINKLKVNYVYKIQLTNGYIQVVKNRNNLYDYYLYNNYEEIQRKENIFNDDIYFLISINKHSFLI